MARSIELTRTEAEVVVDALEGSTQGWESERFRLAAELRQLWGMKTREEQNG